MSLPRSTGFPLFLLKISSLLLFIAKRYYKNILYFPPNNKNYINIGNCSQLDNRTVQELISKLHNHLLTYYYVQNYEICLPTCYILYPFALIDILVSQSRTANGRISTSYLLIATTPRHNT